MSDNASATTFQPGDRVRVVLPSLQLGGKVGTVVSADTTVPDNKFPYTVRVEGGDGRTIIACRADELRLNDAALAAELIAAAEAAGAVEFNRWVADGMLCRRYISPDGNIDLTVRVP